MRSMRELQAGIGDWVVRMFGKQVLLNKQERALRVLEEATEYAQVVGVPLALAHKAIDYTYARPVDKRGINEIGGMLITVLAAAEAEGADANFEADEEMNKLQHRTRPECRERVKNKPHPSNYKLGD